MIIVSVAVLTIIFLAIIGGSRCQTYWLFYGGGLWEDAEMIFMSN